MKVFNKLMLFFGAVSVASAVALPAMAGDGYANGSTTIVLMNGASHSVATELGFTAGAYGVDLTVTPTLTNTLNVNANSVVSVQATPNGLTNNLSLGASFTAAAAQKLAAAGNTLSDNVSIIRAGAGVDGLD